MAWLIKRESRSSTYSPGQIEMAGERVAAFHTRTGQIFAVQADCPHKGGPLADGLLGGTTLLSPLHARKFELATGEPILGGCALKTGTFG